MKLKTNPVVWRILAAVLLPFAVILTARAFGYDVYDLSGWSVAKNGAPCYLSYEGEPLTGWQEVEGETYFFSPEDGGAMHTGWLETGEDRYFLDHNGHKTIGWADLSGGRYYFADDGRQHTGWLEQNGSRYYFADDGLMATGWLEADGGRYFLNEEGVMQTGWMETERGLCYLSETGAVTSGWVDTDKGRFYIRDDGTVHTGWLETDGRKYYLDDNGAMHTGWLDQDDDRYYFFDNGSMAVGRVEIGGENRHFASSGKYVVVVNKWNSVPEDYELNLVWFDSQYQVDAGCKDDLAAMIRDCEAAGYACKISSAYRSHNYQITLFQRKVDKLMAAGYTYADAAAETSRSIAIPGTSEHELGLAIDLKNAFSTYDWLAKNSWKYGFILRYPNGTTQLTGIYYEPWHFRYVGKELAKEIYDSGLCMEAYMDMLTEQQTR